MAPVNVLLYLSNLLQKDRKNKKLETWEHVKCEILPIKNIGEFQRSCSLLVWAAMGFSWKISESPTAPISIPHRKEEAGWPLRVE